MSSTRSFILVWSIGTILLYSAARFAYADDLLSRISGLAAFPVILLFLFAYTKTWLLGNYGTSTERRGEIARTAANILSKAILFIVISEMIIIGKLVLVIVFPIPEETIGNIPQDTELQTKPLVPEYWKTYRNDRYGFELRYPEDLLSSVQTGDDTFIYCNGTTTPDGCDGTFYQLSIAVLKETFDTSRFNTYFDTPVRVYQIGRKQFYTGMQDVFSYSGWAAYTTIGDTTISIHFSGNGFVENPAAITPGELTVMMDVLKTLREI